MTDDLNRILQSGISALPSVVFGAMGWVAHQFYTGSPRMSGRKFLGGILLSGFTGGVTCMLLLQSGLHPELAAIFASVIGSSGSRGYEWLLMKAKDSVTKGE